MYQAVTLSADGGTAPYAWSISSGQLATGLTLSSDGVVTGKSSKAGQFGFTVKVTDTAGGSSTQPAGLQVFAALAVTQPCISQCNVGAGCSVCGGFGTVSGGLGPYTYQVIKGDVPQGMSLSGLSLKGGFPLTPVAEFGLTVQVADVFGAHVTDQAYWYAYNPATLFNGGSCINFNTGSCTATWTYSGGNPSAAPSVLWARAANCDCSSGLPPNFNAVAKGGNVTITAGPVACDQSGWIGQVTLTLVDRTSCHTTYSSDPVDIDVDVSNNC